MRLILLSGLGADGAIFAPQKLCFPQLETPGWLEPLANESLESYARRMLEKIGPIDDQTWIGGASFGGMLALHMAEQVEPRGVILLGSVRSPDQFPLYVRWARRLRWATPLIPVRLLQVTLMPLIMLIAGKRWPRIYGLAWQMKRANPRVIRWSIRALLGWTRTPQVKCPVYHIHGQRDMVLLARLTNPDCIVPGGGHIVSLTHPQAVNEYLQLVTHQRSQHG